MISCCYQCPVELRFWVEPLPSTRRTCSVLLNTTSWKRITGIDWKWRLPLMFTVEINWFYRKWPYKPAFSAFMCLCITENQSLWAFQSGRSISPVLLLKLKNDVVFINLLLSFQCHLVLSIISVFFLPKLNESFSPHQWLLFQKRYNDLIYRLW